MTRQTFTEIVSIVERDHQIRYNGGFLPRTDEECVLITLWYLGTKCSYREVAELFGYSESCVYKCVEKVIRSICDVAQTYIHFPTQEEAIVVEEGFRSVSGFPGVIGAIDGCHIEIKAPDNLQADYIDRSGTHSINLLAVCDHNKKLTYTFAGYPGSAHDSRVYRDSALGRTLLLEPETLMPSASHHILGDSGFQLSSYLLTPYKDYGNLNQRQKKYNKKHSQTRVIIENAFGWLKGRFRRLKYIDAEIPKIKLIVTACCVLHNMTIGKPDEERYLLEELDEDNAEFADNHIVNEVPEVQGREKRDFVASLL